MIVPLLVAVFLGVVEGLTEFIPVSSTGHLIIAEDFLRRALGTAPSLPPSFEVAIQLGAILAVLKLYPGRFWGVLNFSSGDGFKGWRAMGIYSLACFPALTLGAMFHSTIKEHLFSVRTVAWALIVGGFLLILAERLSKVRCRTVDRISFRDALTIGVIQCLALWPGMSRSGSTIFAGRIVGLEKSVAAEFSFIIAVPVISAAVLYDLYKDLSANGLSGLHLSFVGGAVAYVIALYSMRWFVEFLGRVSLVPFAIYRFIVGGVLLLM